MEGRKFNRLTVVGLHSKDANYNKRWLCQCDCGNTAVVLGDKLRSGNTQSCGCYGRELRAAAQHTADIERRDYTKKSWTAMIGRCTNPRYPSYPRYGGSGITVCDRWRFGENGVSGWLCFFSDMGPKPTGFSIDRIDNAKGYSLDNCRWASREQQSENRTKTYRKRSK
jgi:hypothetical protein